MKVLHVISDRNIGGAGVLLTSLLRYMDQKRVESVVALPENSLLSARIQAMGVPVRELKYACDRMDLRAVMELRRLIAREGSDIVHANAALCARIAGKWSGKAVLHTRHCCFAADGIWKNALLCRVGGRWNRMLSDRVIATADAAAENLCRMGIPKEQINVIINGSAEVREVEPMELQALRSRFDLRENDFCVGICARLEAYKGQDVFLAAAKRVMSAHPDIPFRFLIVGDGSKRAYLEMLARRMGISPFVRFTGFVEDMAPIYRMLRVNVNCSCGTETSCLALSEGMSAGVPFVASDYGGNGAMCGGSDAGMIYPTGDAARLADCIARIATDARTEERMRAAARARYEQKYTAVAMSEALTAVYEGLMQRQM